MVGNIVLLLEIIILLHIAYLDLKKRKISNLDCIFLFLLGLFGIIYYKNMSVELLLSILVVFCPILVIFLLLGDRIGAGDIKLILALCFVLTMNQLLWAVFIGMIIALLAVGGLIIVRIPKYRRFKKSIPLGLFISIGAIWSLLIK